MHILKGEQLEKIAFHLFLAAGAPEEHSLIVAQHLADNNLTGHDSHGFIRVLQYIRQIKEGLIIPAAKPVIVSESPGAAQVDGHYGFGQVAAKFSTEVAIDKAKKQGVSCVTVRHLGHLGRLGAYAEMATRAGCAAILFCSTGGYVPYQVPFGGSQRKLGTNPMAMGFPSEEEGPIVSDFATSVAAEGKIRVYRARGHKLPEGWILSKEGRPSNDPNDLYAGGSLLPVGGSVGHKGFCLAFMTDLFGAIMSRDGFPGSPGKQFSNGSLIVAIDIERFAPLAAAKSEVSKMVDYVKDTPPAEGFEYVMYPGEKEAKNRKERGKNGVEIEDETWNQVMALVQEYGVADKLGKLP
ncbi:MAG: Ldh family oxidoreductase [Deltaproteobacteria bacterium]|nr:Ldh family oxidoreductase [Deltaproteobacteria bacterium]